MFPKKELKKGSQNIYTNEEKRKRELESTGLVQKTIIQGGTFTIPLILKKLKKKIKFKLII